MKAKHIWPLAKAAARAWSDDYAPSMGAALAYYTLFSIAPLLLILIAIGGFVFGEDAARGELIDQLRALMGEQSAVALQALLKSAAKPAQGLLATLVGVVAMLFGAMTVFGELQDALDRIWRAPTPPGGSSLKKLLRTRLLSFAMIVGIGALLIASLAASAALGVVEKRWAGASAGWTVLAEVVNFALGFALATVGFAMVYKVLPRVRIQWRDVVVGAAATALLFAIGRFAIGFYLTRTSLASGFGAAGSVVVLLVWMYYSAQIFLLGAEFTWVYAHAYGSRRTTPAASLAQDVPCRSNHDAAEALAASRSTIAEGLVEARAAAR